MVKPPGRPNLALADFTAPRETGIVDYVGGFAVTTGHGLESLVAEFKAAHDDYSAILASALADRLAEAFAERLHELVRRELWGYAADEALTNEDLIAERYQGIRPAPGYPACPDHTEKGPLFDWLEAEERAGIALTESFAMLPGSVGEWLLLLASAVARYFGLGRIGHDQLEDYAQRKGMPVDIDGPLAGPEPGRGLRSGNHVSSIPSYRGAMRSASLAAPRRLVAGLLAASLLLVSTPAPTSLRARTRSISAFAPTSSPRRTSSSASARACR